MGRILLLALAFASTCVANEKSCVAIITYGGGGSGTVVARDGETAFIVTNKHLILDDVGKVEEKIWIIKSGNRYPAKSVKMHSSSDLALVSCVIDLPPAKLASADPNVGDDLMHYGKQTGPQKGVVDEWTNYVVEGRALTSKIFGVMGDSGAGFFNKDGELVGVLRGCKHMRDEERRRVVGERLEVVREFLKGVGK